MRFLGACSPAILFGLSLLGPIVTPAVAQDAGTRPARGREEVSLSGRELFLSSCSQCHGPDGTGGQAQVVGLPIQPPDFTESVFASREPAADWAGIVTHGGPIRGFDRLMPAFGDALSRKEIDLILEYVQTLYKDKSWPRGEFNLPLTLGTEKAFPEDEVLMKTTVGTGNAGSVMSKLIYEKRFGSQTQIEVVVPFGWQQLSDESGLVQDWVGGIGDLAFAVKRVLFHNLGMGTITSFTLETILPTGNDYKGFGKGYTVFEPFLTLGQLLPKDAFVQIQTGVELPTDTEKGENEGLFRVAFGKTFTAGGEWGRAFSPMVEFLGAKELEGGTAVWDIMPELHFTLNQRQHIMANVGVRLPLTETEGRKPQLMFLFLWDWFDGGLFEGW
ncbi:MAG: c-type cytochrome [Longimicrobiales bacterium]|nr:c-type cytochrome [Longimicrobiales bacterium]